MIFKKMILLFVVFVVLANLSLGQCKIYQGRYASGSPIAVTQNGGGACGFAAAAYLLLL
jgi:hypothetical protein